MEVDARMHFRPSIFTLWRRKRKNVGPTLWRREWKATQFMRAIFNKLCRRRDDVVGEALSCRTKENAVHKIDDERSWLLKHSHSQQKVVNICPETNTNLSQREKISNKQIVKVS